MATEAYIDGNKINDARPLAVEQQGAIALAPLPAGTNNIGDVDVASIAAGANEIGSIADAGLAAARAGRGFCQKLNAKTGINAAATVLTDAGLIKATTVGYRDVVCGMYTHLNTPSDWCEFEIVVTANADGSGAVTALSPMFRVESPAVNDDASAHQETIYPPLVITTAMGGAWTVRAQTNDAGCSVTFAFNGWREAV